jgi:hypothetical protein
MSLVSNNAIKRKYVVMLEICPDSNFMFKALSFISHPLVHSLDGCTFLALGSDALILRRALRATYSAVLSNYIRMCASVDHLLLSQPSTNPYITVCTSSNSEVTNFGHFPIQYFHARRNAGETM